MDGTPLAEAARRAGNATNLAKKIDRPQQTVSEWMKRGWPAPDACLAIERVTGVPVADLLKPAKPRKKRKARRAA